MSTATAGKVLLLPKGEYNSATQYKVLDWVLYQGRPYVAKQTTQGNAPIYAPTAANPDNYWQLLLDFPTVVDNVPTENSDNLVKSGGVYSVTYDRMAKDASDATYLEVAKSVGYSSFASALVTKAAGASENVTLTFTMSNPKEITAKNLYNNLYARIDGVVYFDYSDEEIDVVIDSVSIASNYATVTAVGHLSPDKNDAFNFSKTIYFKSCNGGSAGAITSGPGAAVKFLGTALGPCAAAKGAVGMAFGDRAVSVNNGVACGTAVTSVGRSAFAEGEDTLALGYASHAGGDETIARGDYSFSSGEGTEAYGTHSFAAGEDTVAYGNHSVAMGEGTYSGQNGSTSFGRFNDDYAAAGKNSIFHIGNGTTTSNRSNAFTVYEDGYMANGAGNNRYKISKEGGAWGYRTDDDNVFHRFEPLTLTNNAVVLSTSQDTDVVFTNAAITEDSWIDVWTNDYTITPKNVVITSGGGSVTVTFKQVSSAVTIKVAVEIKN